MIFMVMVPETGNVFNRLIDYFQSQADSLDAKAAASRIFENRPDIGTDREEALFEFIAGHLPRRCRITKGGYIFDLSGKESKQIDLIITNDLTIQFTKSLSNTFQKSFNCIEGCYCAISVKSKLDKGALHDSIENLATIPNNKQLNINPELIASPEFLNEIPLKIIFAFKGDKVEYIERLIEEYQTQNSDVNIPNLIIVNNSFLIEKVGSETRRDPNGNVIPSGSSIVMSSSKYIGGIALMHMLTKIQTISNIGSQILMNFLGYTSKTDLTANAIDEIQIDIMRKTR